MRKLENNMNQFDIVIGVNYYFPHVSGLSESARLLAERLVADGLKVRVVCCRHERDLPTLELIGGVEVERVPVAATIRNGPISPLFPFQLARRSRHAQILNLHLPMLESGLIAILARGTSIVVTYHCDYVGPCSRVGRLIERVIDFSNRIAIKRARRVVVSSHDYALQSRLAPSLVNATPISPPFVSRARGLPTFRQSAGYHYGFLGRMTAEKGITYLVQAFHQCAHSDDRLLIGGESSKKLGESVIDEVRGLIEGDPRIILLGFIDEDKMNDFYASLDAFVFPSINRLEAFGIVQMEALSAGVPIVASNLPGVRTIVLETGCGLLAEIGNVADLARAMNEIRNFNMPMHVPAIAGTSLDDYVRLFQSMISITQ
jgi:glycosyltransferase involved in cell wall biosynthesis